MKDGSVDGGGGGESKDGKRMEEGDKSLQAKRHAKNTAKCSNRKYAYVSVEKKKHAYDLQARTTKNK